MKRFPTFAALDGHPELQTPGVVPDWLTNRAARRARAQRARPVASSHVTAPAMIPSACFNVTVGQPKCDAHVAP